jgi:hypothetical protein
MALGEFLIPNGTLLNFHLESGVLNEVNGISSAMAHCQKPARKSIIEYHSAPLRRSKISLIKGNGNVSVTVTLIPYGHGNLTNPSALGIKIIRLFQGECDFLIIPALNILSTSDFIVSRSV